MAGLGCSAFFPIEHKPRRRRVPGPVLGDVGGTDCVLSAWLRRGRVWGRAAQEHRRFFIFDDLRRSQRIGHRDGRLGHPDCQANDRIAPPLSHCLTSSLCVCVRPCHLEVYTDREPQKTSALTNPNASMTLWGPYLSERQWGTVREDYSTDGNAWEYFPHDMARSRAYRWGEDGLAGICDDAQTLCFALAMWNGRRRRA